MLNHKSSLSRLILLTLLVSLTIQLNIVSGSHLLIRRQSESTRDTPTSNDKHQESPRDSGRLYPDLIQQTNGFIRPPPFGLQPPASPVVQPPTPFVPFGRLEVPSNTQFNDPRFQPRPLSSAERIQSQTFTDGLGKRLLSIIGIQSQPEANATNSENQVGQPMSLSPQDTMLALHNSTILQQLNKGVHSVYGGLSKMYNETVRQQLNLLQERFKKESENSTNPWQQRMAQQVPQFFKSISMRVDEAQSNLNRLLRDVTQVGNGTMNISQVLNNQRNGMHDFFSSVDQFFRPVNGNSDLNNPFQNQGNFFSQFGRQFGFSGQNQPSIDRAGEPEKVDLMTQLRMFWANQVQPQMSNMRGQIARTWRDLTSSGALMPQNMIMSRSSGANRMSGNGSVEKGEDLVDDILKEVDMSGSSEYSLIEPKNESPSGGENQANPSKGNPIMTQMQSGLMSMQRDLNQLWMGLSNSIQNALSNVQKTMNPNRQPMGLSGATSTPEDRVKEADPEENEIESKIKELNKVQRDADAVYNVVQQQQNSLQRPSFGDRFKNFFNNMNLGTNDRPVRFGDSMSGIGTAVADMWNQIG